MERDDIFKKFLLRRRPLSRSIVEEFILTHVYFKFN